MTQNAAAARLAMRLSKWTSVPEPFLAEAGTMLSRGVALSVNQMAQMGIVLTDVVMMGWLGVDALGAGSLTSGIWVLFYCTALGILMAVLPMVGSAHGAGRTGLALNVVQAGILLATIMAVIAAAIMLATPYLAETVHGLPAITRLSQDYLTWSVASYLPIFWSLALRNYLIAVDRIGWINRIALCALGVNAFGNYGLAFGHFGFPEMGLAGIGLSTTVTCATSFALLWASLRFCRETKTVARRLFVFRWPRDIAAELLRVGVPTAMILFIEAGLLTGASIMTSYFGVTAIAAYGLSIQWFNMALMIPIGIAQAATVRVAFLAGRSLPTNLMFAGWAAVLITAIVSCVIWLLFAFQDRNLVLLLANPENTGTGVIDEAAGLLMIAGCMQTFCGMVIVMAAVMRGLRDTSSALWDVMACYWVFGLGSAAAGGFLLGLGTIGIWTGMTIGFIAAFCSLGIKLRRKLVSVETIILEIQAKDAKCS